MSNIYSRTSFSIKDLTPCESNWLQDEYERLSLGVPPDPSSPEWSPEWGIIEQGTYHVGFCSFNVRPREGRISSDSFLIAQLVEFLQRFLVKFRPNAFIAFTWADTCDMMRDDHFSGGTVAVTARGVSSCNGSHVIDWARGHGLESACSLVG